MAALLRILFLAPIAFAVACAAAASVIVFALIGGFPPMPWPQEVVAAVATATFAVAAIAALPALVATLLAEAFGWRSLFYWLAVGGLIAAMVVATPWLAEQMQVAAALVLLVAWVPQVSGATAAEPASFVTIAFAASFVGGFVYWLLAGRLSGYSDVTSRA